VTAPVSAPDANQLAADNVKAAGAITLASAVFVFNDAIMKYVAESISMMQAMSVRGWIVTVVFAIAAWVRGDFARVGMLKSRLVWARAGLETTGSLAFMSALPHVPLAIATALVLSTPLLLIPLSAIFLGQSIGLRRTLAVAVGFSGVLLVVRPSAEGVDIWLALVAVSAIFFALRDVATRRLPPQLPALLIALVMALTVTLATTALALWQGWQPMGTGVYVGVLAAALFVGTGYMLMVRAMRIGEIALTGSFRYSAIPFGVGLGWLVWGEFPDLVAWCGIALILGSGIYALHRERMRTRLSATARVPPASD
jgi:drug/metabolite transporter (DMT)-like permease